MLADTTLTQWSAQPENALLMEIHQEPDSLAHRRGDDTALLSTVAGVLVLLALVKLARHPRAG